MTDVLQPQISLFYVVAKTSGIVDTALAPYGYPATGVVILSTPTAVNALIATAPLNTIPWTILREDMKPDVSHAMYTSMKSYFGESQAMYKCVSMLNTGVYRKGNQ